jgi:hypothetical protein
MVTERPRSIIMIIVSFRFPAVAACVSFGAVLGLCLESLYEKQAACETMALIFTPIPDSARESAVS